MEEIWHILNRTLLLTQLISVIIGCFYFKKLKSNYWKWFVLYLTIILIQEFLFNYLALFSRNTSVKFYFYFGVPFQFIFLYWLYAKKSLKSDRLCIVSIIIFIVASIAIGSFLEGKIAIALRGTMASLILSVLVVLEFIKQIKDDSILSFQENKMFYINFGVLLFYFGTLPFQTFELYAYKDYKSIVEYYYVYFLIANCIMYLLFAASFIWGKEQQ